MRIKRGGGEATKKSAQLKRYVTHMLASGHVNSSYEYVGHEYSPKKVVQEEILPPCASAAATIFSLNQSTKLTIRNPTFR